jgi:hypothetical protein
MLAADIGTCADQSSIDDVPAICAPDAIHVRLRETACESRRHGAGLLGGAVTERRSSCDSSELLGPAAVRLLKRTGRSDRR